ncbi:hypothetical protein [Novosphingobium malaysiense]|nr:hypothetical protein [Novosphingobium malaysiense]
MSAGDAAPYLERDMYVLLGFEPGFDQLPERPRNSDKATGALWSDWR